MQEGDSDININDIFLGIAYLAKYKELSEVLLSYKGEVDVNYQDPRSGFTALIQCVRGHVPTSKKSVAPNHVPNNDPPSSLSDCQSCLQLLHEFGADVNLYDMEGKTALHWAADLGAVKLVEQLMELGADAREEDMNGLTALQSALKSQHLDCLQAVVQACPDKSVVNEENSHGTFPLTYAVRLGNVDGCQYLVDQGALVNAQELQKFGRTPLHYAVHSKNLPVFELLLRHGARVNIPDNQKKCVIHKAATVNDSSFLSAIFSITMENDHETANTASPEASDSTEIPNEDGATALMLACQRDNVENVRILLARNVCVTSKDYTGKTALHYSVENVDVDIARMLLERDPSLLDLKDNEGYTALQLAVIANNVAIIKFLLTQGSDINTIDNDGHTVIHWATVCGHVDLIDLLQVEGAALSVADSHHAYPLHYAAQMCGATGEGADPKVGLQMLNKLLSKKVAVDCTDQDSRTPLHWAASAVKRSPGESGSHEACEALIKAGADVEAGDKDGLTAVHCAASRGHATCVKVLVKHGGRVDSTDKNGCSPLFYAITLGHLDSGKVLMSKKANSSLQDKRGRSPAHCAAAKGSIEALRILQQQKGDLWLRNAKGECPIHEAALAKQNATVVWLLQNHPNKKTVNVGNKDKRTCLHIAALTNNLQLCKILVDYGASKNACMLSKGQKLTPFDAATLKKNDQCVEYLRQIGAKSVTEKTKVEEDEEIEDHFSDEDEKQDPEKKEEEPKITDQEENAEEAKEEKPTSEESKEEEGEDRNDGDEEDDGEDPVVSKPTVDEDDDTTVAVVVPAKSQDNHSSQRKSRRGSTSSKNSRGSLEDEKASIRSDRKQENKDKGSPIHDSEDDSEKSQQQKKKQSNSKKSSDKKRYDSGSEEEPKSENETKKRKKSKSRKNSPSVSDTERVSSGKSGKRKSSKSRKSSTNQKFSESDSENEVATESKGKKRTKSKTRKGSSKKTNDGADSNKTGKHKDRSRSKTRKGNVKQSDNDSGTDNEEVVDGKAQKRKKSKTRKGSPKKMKDESGSDVEVTGDQKVKKRKKSKTRKGSSKKVENESDSDVEQASDNKVKKRNKSKTRKRSAKDTESDREKERAAKVNKRKKSKTRGGGGKKSDIESEHDDEPSDSKPKRSKGKTEGGDVQKSTDESEDDVFITNEKQERKGEKRGSISSMSGDESNQEDEADGSTERHKSGKKSKIGKAVRDDPKVCDETDDSLNECTDESSRENVAVLTVGGTKQSTPKKNKSTGKGTKEKVRRSRSASVNRANTENKQRGRSRSKKRPQNNRSKSKNEIKQSDSEESLTGRQTTGKVVTKGDNAKPNKSKQRQSRSQSKKPKQATPKQAEKRVTSQTTVMPKSKGKTEHVTKQRSQGRSQSRPRQEISSSSTKVSNQSMSRSTSKQRQDLVNSKSKVKSDPVKKQRNESRSQSRPRQENSNTKVSNRSRSRSTSRQRLNKTQPGSPQKTKTVTNSMPAVKEEEPKKIRQNGKEKTFTRDRASSAEALDSSKEDEGYYLLHKETKIGNENVQKKSQSQQVQKGTQSRSKSPAKNRAGSSKKSRSRSLSPEKRSPNRSKSPQKSRSRSRSVSPEKTKSKGEAKDTKGTLEGDRTFSRNSSVENENYSSKRSKSPQKSRSRSRSASPEKTKSKGNFKDTKGTAITNSALEGAKTLSRSSSMEKDKHSSKTSKNPQKSRSQSRSVSPEKTQSKGQAKDTKGTLEGDRTFSRNSSVENENYAPKRSKNPQKSRSRSRSVSPEKTKSKGQAKDTKGTLEGDRTFSRNSSVENENYSPKRSKSPQKSRSRSRSRSVSPEKTKSNGRAKDTKGTTITNSSLGGDRALSRSSYEENESTDNEKAVLEGKQAWQVRDKSEINDGEHNPNDSPEPQSHEVFDSQNKRWADKSNKPITQSKEPGRSSPRPYTTPSNRDDSPDKQNQPEKRPKTVPGNVLQSAHSSRSKGKDRPMTREQSDIQKRQKAKEKRTKTIYSTENPIIEEMRLAKQIENRQLTRSKTTMSETEPKKLSKENKKKKQLQESVYGTRAENNVRTPQTRDQKTSNQSQAKKDEPHSSNTLRDMPSNKQAVSSTENTSQPNKPTNRREKTSVFQAKEVKPLKQQQTIPASRDNQRTDTSTHPPNLPQISNKQSSPSSKTQKAPQRSNHTTQIKQKGKLEENMKLGQNRYRNEIQEWVRVFEMKKLAVFEMQQAKRMQMQNNYQGGLSQRTMATLLKDDYNERALPIMKMKKGNFSDLDSFTHYLQGHLQKAHKDEQELKSRKHRVDPAEVDEMMALNRPVAKGGNSFTGKRQRSMDSLYQESPRSRGTARDEKRIRAKEEEERKKLERAYKTFTPAELFKDQSSPTQNKKSKKAYQLPNSPKHEHHSPSPSRTNSSSGLPHISPNQPVQHTSKKATSYSAENSECQSPKNAGGTASFPQGIDAMRRSEMMTSNNNVVAMDGGSADDVSVSSSKAQRGVSFLPRIKASGNWMSSPWHEVNDDKTEKDGKSPRRPLVFVDAHVYDEEIRARRARDAAFQRQLLLISEKERSVQHSRQRAFVNALKKNQDRVEERSQSSRSNSSCLYVK